MLGEGRKQERKVKGARGQEFIAWGGGEDCIPRLTSKKKKWVKSQCGDACL
jgi:hypothetical protein